MADNDSAAMLRRVEQTLDAAAQAVESRKEWAERIRENWKNTERVKNASVEVSNS